jgi:hypothetical protein
MKRATSETPHPDLSSGANNPAAETHVIGQVGAAISDRSVEGFPQSS